MNHRGLEKNRYKEMYCLLYLFCLFFSVSLFLLCVSVVQFLLAGKFDGAGFADDRDFDLTGIVQLFLDRLGDVVTDLDGIAV